MIKHFILLFALLMGCTTKHVVDNALEIPAPTVQLGQRVFECDSALNVRDLQAMEMTSEIWLLKDSISKLTVTTVCKEDSLRKALFIANYKVEGVKKYLKICDRNPTQIKFLRGWIHRAID